ncbi:MAG TPA: DUF192 domain-containing protein [Candidatus Elarobacter sp.]|jgi:hypothetical protein|nr:DUF192 domain-containing protein [Candidatus Elarobacter sp.]
MQAARRSPGGRGALVAAAALFALTAQGPAPADSALPLCTRIPLTAQCRAVEVRAPHEVLHLAVALTNAQREHGLMNVSFVPPGQGMLFAFPFAERHMEFWMKDTITPLDMVFVKADGTISEIAVDVPASTPKTPDAKIARRQGVGRFVIELGAGEAARAGLLPGMQLAIPPVQAK